MPDPVVERRLVPRLPGPFGSQVVCGRGAGRVSEEVLAEDISVRAVRLRLPDGSIAPGERVFAVLRLSIVDGGSGPRVAIRGHASRVERWPDGSVAVVVMVAQRRWLFASPAIGREVVRS